MNIDPERVTQTLRRFSADAEAGGYHLNPDEGFTRRLIEGILTNQDRYGYGSCPCRLADGDRQEDLDIVCPCDYRDPDLNDYGACYCALYVSGDVLRGAAQLIPVPERRPETRTVKAAPAADGIRLWRCKVCGYLCVREHPPETCPVCKAKADRFEAYVLPASALPGR